MLAVKQRLEFIDLAKGICIILVVMLHAYGDVGGIVHYLRMPFYFTISGMFFKDYGGIINLIVRKINKLIIPFVFYYILIWIVHWIAQLIQPGFWDYPGSFWGDLWESTYMNIPIWFFLCLYWCNLFFFFINNYTSRRYTPFVIVGSAVVSCVFMYYEFFCPFYILQSLVALPFFYIGNRLRTSKIVTSERSWSQFYFSIFLICLVVFLDLFSKDSVSFNLFRMHGNILLYYVKSITMVIAALLLCKCIRRVPLVSYCGRYSIVVLGVHTIFCEISYHLHNWVGESIYMDWYRFAFVLVCSICCIPVMIYIFPYFTAQKDLIKLI